MADDSQLISALTSLTQQIALSNQLAQQKNTNNGSGKASTGTGGGVPTSSLAGTDTASTPQVVSDKMTSLEEEGQVFAAAQLGESGPQLYRKFRLGSYNLQQTLQLASNAGGVLAGNTTSPGIFGGRFQGLGESLQNMVQYKTTTDDNGQTVYATDSNGNPIAQGIKNPFYSEDEEGNPTGWGPKTITSGMAQFGLATASGAAKMVGSIDNLFGTQATIGQTFGYGPGITGAGGGILGASVLSHGIFKTGTTAQQVGMGFQAAKEALMGLNPSGGNVGFTGLSGATAQSDLDVLGNQGFQAKPTHTPWSTPGGDAYTIASQLFKPLQEQMPGLTAQTLGQFTPQIRTATTSASALASALSDLSAEATATKETVNEVASSLATAANQYASMGAQLGSATGTGTAFMAATGMDAQIGSQLAQNPLVQGLGLQQGILPSNLGNSGPTTTQTELSALKMYQQIFSGLNQNTYETVGGRRVLAPGGLGSEKEDSQLAAYTGMSEARVAQMLGESSGITQRDAALKLIGSQTGNNNLGSGLNEELRADIHHDNGNPLTKYEESGLQTGWSQIESKLRAAGISSSKIKDLNDMGDTSSDWTQRLKDAHSDVTTRAGESKYNKVNGGGTGADFTIGLSAAASKLLTITGPSIKKKESNAGGETYLISLQSVAGDLSQDVIKGLKRIF